jgi:alkylation response protein AidB-like acyl-CoA dehydrogenase
VTERTGTWEKVNAPDPTLPSTAVGADPDAERLGLLGGTELDDARADVLVSQAAALAGQSQAMLDSTVAYLTTREQFGVPIGSFQALRHRAADCATEVYAAQQLSIHAAAELRRHREPLALGQLAKAFVGQAVQLHGGMGFTWEGGVHFGLKRIMHLAMTGPTVAECEEHLGRRALSSDALLWAGGLDDDGDSRSPNDTEDG